MPITELGFASAEEGKRATNSKSRRWIYEQFGEVERDTIMMTGKLQNSYSND